MLKKKKENLKKQPKKILPTSLSAHGEAKAAVNEIKLLPRASLHSW